MIFGDEKMSIRFSRIKAVSKDKAALFLGGGIPHSKEDLKGWKAFDSFSALLEDNERVIVSVETFEYGDGSPYDATPEEIAYIFMRESMRSDFIDSRAKMVSESEFSIIIQN